MLTLYLQALSDAKWHDEARGYSSEPQWLWCDSSPVVLLDTYSTLQRRARRGIPEPHCPVV